MHRVFYICVCRLYTIDRRYPRVSSTLGR